MEFNGFFSYSHTDSSTEPQLFEALSRELETRVQQRLANASFTLWRDTANLRLADKWNSEIEAAVRRSQIFIAVASPRWLSSSVCCLEYSTFLSKEKSLGENTIPSIVPIIIRNIDRQVSYLKDFQMDIYSDIRSRQGMRRDIVELGAVGVAERSAWIDRVAVDVAGIIEKHRSAGSLMAEASKQPVRYARPVVKRELSPQAYDFRKIDILGDSEVLIRDGAGGEATVCGQVDFVEKLYVESSGGRVEFGVKRALLVLKSNGAGKVRPSDHIRNSSSHARLARMHDHPTAVVLSIDPRDNQVTLGNLSLPPGPSPSENRICEIGRIEADSVAEVSAVVTVSLNAEGIFLTGGKTIDVSNAQLSKIEAILAVAADKQAGSKDGIIERVIEVHDVLDRISQSDTITFRELAIAAGLDPSKDFVGVDLSGIDFREEDLSGFDFSKADLRFADFRRAKLDGLTFNEANIVGAIGLPGPKDANSSAPRSRRELKNIIARGDLPPKEFVKNLRELRFGDTVINEISVLRNIKTLEVLSLINRYILDFSPIEDLKELRILNLDGSNVKSFDSIKTLGHLSVLTAGGSSLENIRGIEGSKNLNILDVSDTYVEDISLLSGINLVRLDIGRTSVDSIRPLKEMSKLVHLSLEFCPVIDISILRNLLRLRTLNLNGTKVVDLSPISDLVNIDRLYMSGTKVTDISCVKNLNDLQILIISNNKILYPDETIKNLKNLRRLSASSCGVMSEYLDISAMNQLNYIDLSYNNIQKLSIGDLTDSEFIYINIDGNPISDISFLAKLNEVSMLSLRGTQLVDFAPLDDIENIRQLKLGDIEFKKLERIWDRGNVKTVIINERTFKRTDFDLSKLKGARSFVATGAIHETEVYLSRN